MSTRAPIARSRPPRGVHHLIALSTPMLAPRLPSADPSSALSCSGRSTPRPGRCGRRCRRPETPRIPSGRITVADEGNPRPKRVWGAASSLGSPTSCHPKRSLPAGRASERVNHHQTQFNPLAAPCQRTTRRYSIAAPHHSALPSTDRDSTAAPPSFTSHELARPGSAPVPDGPVRATSNRPSAAPRKSKNRAE